MKVIFQTLALSLLLGATAGCGQDPSNALLSGNLAHVSNSSEDSSLNGVNVSPLPSAVPASMSPAVTPTPAPTPFPSVAAKDIRYKDKVIVLMYHHIAESEAGEEVTIVPSKFESHLKVLKDNKYQVISIEDYVRYVKENKAVPPNAVVITFDDGYESFYKYAYPLLKKYGYTATNFVVTSYIDSNNPSLPFMTWDEIKQMRREGFSFYSHSHNLHAKVKGADSQLVSPLASRIWLPEKNRLETEQEYRKRVSDDLSLANQMLHEKIGNEMNILCFPYGFYNKTVMEVGNDIGIDFFFTTKEGINTKQDKEIVRLQAGTRYMTAELLLAKLNKFSERLAASSTPTKR